MRAKSATKRDKSKSKEHVVLGIINPLPNKNKHERKGQISPSNERVIGMQPDGVRIELTRQINRQAMKSARQRDVPLPADET